MLSNRYKKLKAFNLGIYAESSASSGYSSNSTDPRNFSINNVTNPFLYDHENRDKILPIKLSNDQKFSSFDKSNSVISWAKLERAVCYEASKLKNTEDLMQANIRLYEINTRHIAASLESKNYNYASKVLLKSLDNVIFKTLSEKNAVKNLNRPIESLVSEFDNNSFKNYFTQFLKRDDESTQHVIKLQILCSELMHKYEKNDCQETAICCSLSSGIRSFRMVSKPELSGRAFICTADWLKEGYQFLNNRTDQVYHHYYNYCAHVKATNAMQGGYIPQPTHSDDGLVENLTTILKLESEQFSQMNQTSIANLPKICTDKNMQIIGSLYHLATHKAKNLGQAWLKYADFCYGYSKKLDFNLIKSYVYDQLQQKYMSQNMIQFNANMEYELKSNIQNYEFCLYRQCVEAYERYLNLSDKNTIGTITSTLRLMKILINQSNKDQILETMLNNCFLTNTPVEVWTDILPQILARIIILDKNSNTYNIITKLLTRITFKSPELIVFAALERKHEFLIDEIKKNKNGQKLLNEVKLLIAQLNKTANLWNELWQNTFQKIKFEQSKALNQLYDEEKRLKNNPKITNEQRNNMIKEQIMAIMKPILNEFNKVNSKIMNDRKKILKEYNEQFNCNLKLRGILGLGFLAFR